jgi:hypothetical protein
MKIRTSARVDITVQNNAWWTDAFIFGTAGDTTWSFTNQTFSMDVKGNSYDASPLFELSTVNGRIIVDDLVQRILHFSCTDADVSAALAVNTDDGYVYDLIMIDGNTGARVPLMHGKVYITQGVTGDD